MPISNRPVQPPANQPSVTIISYDSDDATRLRGIERERVKGDGGGGGGER